MKKYSSAIKNSNSISEPSLVAVIWFYLANLCILFASVSSVGFSVSRALSVVGLFCQAAVLGIWLGVGGSSLWKRWLLFASSFYYFAWSLPDESSGINLHTVCLLGGWVLAIAIVMAAFRAMISFANRKPLFEQFSLAKLLSGVAVSALALAIWTESIRQVVQKQDSRHEFYLSMIVVLLYACYVAIVALPLFFRNSEYRWGAFRCSLFLQIPVVIFATLAWTLSAHPIVAGWRIDPVGIFYQVCFLNLIALTLVSLTIFPAEIALSWWKIELARPVDGKERGEASQAVETDPLGVETEAPQ